jgi:thiamine kinase-like enzyme
LNKLIETAPIGTSYHIDHIIPISAFNLNDINHIKLAHSPDNLHWLPADINRSKRDLIDWELIELNPKLIEIANIIGLKKF